MRQGDILQEDAVLAQDEALAARELVVLPRQRILRKALPISFIGGKVFDVVDAVGGGGGSLVGREITDEVGAAARNGLPQARA